MEYSNIINNSQSSTSEGIFSYYQHNINLNYCSFINNYHSSSSTINLFTGYGNCKLILNNCYFDQTPSITLTSSATFENINILQTYYINYNIYINTYKCESNSNIDNTPLSTPNPSPIPCLLGPYYSISEGTTEIIDYQFFQCYELININIPKSIIKIGISSFQYCTALTNITIPIHLSIISKYAFFGCTNLTEIIFLGNIAIESNAFSNCISLRNIIIHSNLTNISNNIFNQINQNITILYYGTKFVETIDFLDIEHITIFVCSHYQYSYFGGFPIYSFNLICPTTCTPCSNLENETFFPIPLFTFSLLILYPCNYNYEYL
jgi:hypothetical protein